MRSGCCRMSTLHFLITLESFQSLDLMVPLEKTRHVIPDSTFCDTKATLFSAVSLVSPPGFPKVTRFFGGLPTAAAGGIGGGAGITSGIAPTVSSLSERLSLSSLAHDCNMLGLTHSTSVSWLSCFVKSVQSLDHAAVTVVITEVCSMVQRTWLVTPE